MYDLIPFDFYKFYVMAQAGMAFHHETVYEGSFDSYMSYSPYSYRHDISSRGIMYGVGVGLQMEFDRVIIDYYVGVKGFRMNHELNEYFVENKAYQPNDFLNLNGGKYIDNQFSDSGKFIGQELGVGSFINCGINIGYRF